MTGTEREGRLKKHKDIVTCAANVTTEHDFHVGAQATTGTGAVCGKEAPAGGGMLSGHLPVLGLKTL